MAHCCVTLRGATYFMVTAHLVGSLLTSLVSLHLFLYPPAYPDINLSPLLMSQIPLFVAAYTFISSLFSIFIFMAVDSESVNALKCSGVFFALYQSLIFCIQLLFTIMFGDILSPSGQLVFGSTILINALFILTYLGALLFFGKMLATATATAATGNGRKERNKGLVKMNSPTAFSLQDNNLQSSYSKKVNICIHEVNLYGKKEGGGGGTVGNVEKL